MSRKLIELLNKMCSENFNDNDVEAYIKSIDNFIVWVYNRRYNNIWKPSKSDIGNYKIGERGHYNYRDGRIRVDPNTFQELCWDELHNANLLNKICDKTFPNDRALVRFIYNSFQNILQKLIDDLSPWLETRKKQVHSLLKTFCLDIKIKGVRCWKLKVYGDRILKPANPEQLQKAGTLLQVPKLRFPRNPDSGRGPSVSATEMRDYLEKLLKSIGGMVARNDLIEFIKFQYGLKSIRQVDISTLSSPAQGFDLRPDHYAMARQIYEKMPTDTKDVYYCRRIKGLTGKKTAARLAIATGTVSNKEKEIDSMFYNYFFVEQDFEKMPVVSADRSSNEEVEAVKQLVSTLILEERETS